MKILAVDSSSEILSICVFDDDILLGEYTIKNLQTHSPKILPMIDELLRNIFLKLEDIDTYAISIGPGSFTGLRIGLALVKGFAQAQNKPIIGIPTLLSLAKQVTPVGFLVCPMIDARNDNIYTCIFDDKFNLVLNYDCIHIDELIKICNKQKLPIYFIGDGAKIHKETLQKNIKSKKICKISNAQLSARTLGSIAVERFSNGDVDNVLALSPMYLRQTQAEREKAANGKS